jgi:hypothetical protein
MLQTIRWDHKELAIVLFMPICNSSTNSVYTYCSRQFWNWRRTKSNRSSWCVSFPSPCKTLYNSDCSLGELRTTPFKQRIPNRVTLQAVLSSALYRWPWFIAPPTASTQGNSLKYIIMVCVPVSPGKMAPVVHRSRSPLRATLPLAPTQHVLWLVEPRKEYPEHSQVCASKWPQ